MSKINIGVTGTGSLIGQAIIKSIRNSQLKESIDCIGLDYFSGTVGSFWCKKNYILPDILNPLVKEEEWLKVITETIVDNQIKLLFVGVDFELPLFAKYKRMLRKIWCTYFSKFRKSNKYSRR